MVIRVYTYIANNTACIPHTDEAYVGIGEETQIVAIAWWCMYYTARATATTAGTIGAGAGTGRCGSTPLATCTCTEHTSVMPVQGMSAVLP